jgi:hypothetical protein
MAEADLDALISGFDHLTATEPLPSPRATLRTGYIAC